MKERVLKAKAGLPMLILFTSLYLTAIALIILGGILIAREANKIGGLLLAAGILLGINRVYPLFRAQDPQTPGSLGPYPVREIYRNA